MIRINVVGSRSDCFFDWHSRHQMALVALPPTVAPPHLGRRSAFRCSREDRHSGLGWATSAAHTVLRYGSTRVHRAVCLQTRYFEFHTKQRDVNLWVLESDSAGKDPGLTEVPGENSHTSHNRVRRHATCTTDILNVSTPTKLRKHLRKGRQRDNETMAILWFCKDVRSFSGVPQLLDQ